MDSKYILYVHEDCPFCKKASSLLREKNKNFNTLGLKRRPKVLAELKKIYDWPTVPIIVEQHMYENASTLVGGYTDLCMHLESK